jgi:hypothetical protein
MRVLARRRKENRKLWGKNRKQEREREREGGGKKREGGRMP